MDVKRDITTAFREKKRNLERENIQLISEKTEDENEFLDEQKARIRKQLEKEYELKEQNLEKDFEQTRMDSRAK